MTPKNEQWKHGIGGVEMTLDEAIKHAIDKSRIDGDACNINCIECKAEHKKLAEWLQELKERRESSLRPATSIQNDVIKAVLAERQRQDEKWGEQNHLPQFWTGILGEEYGELCQAINETVFDNGEEERKKGGYENMRKEAIHVAAVAVGFLECLERNRGY